ncbi:MAG: HypC/HybG/HupF family hydrogenase formation chaperone [Candidatus Lokiarchaeota archaeon]|nr:HypC/HybG/HupF family hydrogenase formation chaperone [Candidatus Harpocratesius repetitus]
MCLAIPGKILTLEGTSALADFDGTQKKIVTALLPRVKVGDYVIVHAGYAIETISQEAAAESIALWRNMISDGLIDKSNYV